MEWGWGCVPSCGLAGGVGVMLDAVGCGLAKQHSAAAAAVMAV